MDIKRCGLFVLLFAVSFIGLSGLLSDNVSAVSEFDNTVANSESLVVHDPWSPSCSEPLDYTADLITKITDDEHYIYYYNGSYSGYSQQLTADDRAELLSVLDGNGGQYAIVQHVGLDNVKEVVIYWNSNVDDTIATFKSFDNGSTELSFAPDGYKQMIFRTDNYTCRTDMYIWTGGFGTPQMAFYDNAYSKHTRKVFDTNIGVEYPEGYEGEIIEGSGNAKENLYPHFTYLVTDKEIKATHDLTQELPELPEPDEGWQNNQWQVMWYLFKCSSIDDDDIIDCPDRESVHSELLERDEIYEWEVDEYGDYLLIAEFRYQSCYRYASWPDTPDNCILNSEHDEYSFVPGRTVYLPIDGMNIVGNTADLNCDVAGNCYDDTRFKDCNVVAAIATLSFDNFNYADCLENVSLLANMLSFNTIKFSNSWVSSGNCYTLGTLGNWLNLDNKHVCPYFSNEVRNTVTPFITFLLGLMMIKFIAGKGAHGSREVDI